MKKSIFMFFALLSMTVSGQMKIVGNVISTNIPVEFAEIVLITKDSTVVSSEFTNEKGDFIINAEVGLYILQIRQINKLLFSKDIELKNNIDLGTITINDVNVLESVVVENKKKLLERKIDRLIFNVENSISSSGRDAIEALKVTPGIKVQNDRIVMIGKSNLSVMINDKILQLSGEDLINYLRTIPSDDIKSIEVITTPPAKYEAQGNSGLVNIILKKSKKNAWNALIGSTYLQRKYSEGSIMGNFNYNKNKLGISSSINYGDGIITADREENAYFADGLWNTTIPAKLNYNSINTKLDLDYQISSKWIIGSQFTLAKSKRALSYTTYTPFYDSAGQIDSYLDSNGYSNQKPDVKSVNLYNEFKLDTLGKKITLNLDYFNFENNDPRTYAGISVTENTYSKKYFEGVNINNQNITNYSVKLDIDYPTKWAVLGFGGKISNSESINDISSFNSNIVDDPIEEFQLIDNRFVYNENVQAGYISGSKKISTRWDAKLGLRIEATQTNSFAENLILYIKNDYIKFFPTAYLSYTATENSTFTFNYSKRINRPRFYDLNPNIYYTNPFLTIEGNAFLQPAFIDNFELTYTYKSLESKLYVSYENNVFSQIPVPDPDTNIVRYITDNFIKTQRYGISENYVFSKYKCWTSYNTVDFNYTISKSTLAITDRETKGFNSTISTNNDFTLNANKTLLFNLSYWYGFPGVDGIYDNKAASSLSASIQYLLLNKDLKISLAGSDIFRTEIYNTSSTVNNVLNTSRFYNDSQSFKISISYKIGNKMIEEKQRVTGNQEERIRAGN